MPARPRTETPPSLARVPPATDPASGSRLVGRAAGAAGSTIRPPATAPRGRVRLPASLEVSSVSWTASWLAWRSSSSRGIGRASPGRGGLGAIGLSSHGGPSSPSSPGRSGPRVVPRGVRPKPGPAGRGPAGPGNDPRPGEPWPANPGSVCGAGRPQTGSSRDRVRRSRDRGSRYSRPRSRPQCRQGRMGMQCAAPPSR
jgi:hypothetical protein